MTDPLSVLGEDSSQNKNARVTAPVIAVASGKGGVGKTTVAVNLASAVTALKKRVVLIDADLGLANVDIMLGLNPQFNLQDVIMGDKNIEDVVVTAGNGFKVIPAGSGVKELADLSEAQCQKFIEAFYKLIGKADLILLDIGAGIGPNAINFASAANEIIMVTSPDPAAVTDAYAMIKVLCSSRQDIKINVLVNLAAGEKEGRRVAENINKVTNQFLNRDVRFLGFIPRDSRMQEAVRKHKTFLELFPTRPVSANFHSIAFKLCFHKDFGSDPKSIKGLLANLMRRVTG